MVGVRARGRVRRCGSTAATLASVIRLQPRCNFLREAPVNT